MQTAVPKQYLSLQGRPIVLQTLDRICSCPQIRGVLVGIAPDDHYWPGLTVPPLGNFLGTFEGGSVRARTVLNGLAALSAYAGPTDWVIVHDAVRPCVRHADLEKLLGAARACPDGALLASPVADTVKRGDSDDRVQETVSRAGLWRALTPQMFSLEKLREALSDALGRGEEITDESAAMESMGARPVLVEGYPDNIKITHATDLVLADLFLKRQAEERG